jgi:hypothetical protein
MRSIKSAFGRVIEPIAIDDALAHKALTPPHSPFAVLTWPSAVSHPSSARAFDGREQTLQAAHELIVA